MHQIYGRLHAILKWHPAISTCTAELSQFRGLCARGYGIISISRSLFILSVSKLPMVKDASYNHIKQPVLSRKTVVFRALIKRGISKSKRPLYVA